MEEAERVSTSQTLEDTAQERTTLAQLSALLAQLAERGRELVGLKFGAGLTNRAIAQIRERLPLEDLIKVAKSIP